MSTISEAFDALSKDRRLQLLLDLELQDPMRYSDREEEDLRFSNLVYEVQSELVRRFHHGRWSGVAVRGQRSANAKGNRGMTNSGTNSVRTQIAIGIKDFRFTISRSSRFCLTRPSRMLTKLTAKMRSVAIWPPGKESNRGQAAQPSWCHYQLCQEKHQS